MIFLSSLVRLYQLASIDKMFLADLILGNSTIKITQVFEETHHLLLLVQVIIGKIFLNAYIHLFPHYDLSFGQVLGEQLNTFSLHSIPNNVNYCMSLQMVGTRETKP